MGSKTEEDRAGHVSHSSHKTQKVKPPVKPTYEYDSFFLSKTAAALDIGHVSNAVFMLETWFSFPVRLIISFIPNATYEHPNTLTRGMV